MKKRMTILGLYLLLTLLLISGCGTEPTAPIEETTIVPDAESELANPASVYCEDQGYALEIRTDEAGGQFGVCIFPNGTECEEWAFFRGTCNSEQAEQTAVDVSPLMSPVAAPEPPSAAPETVLAVEGWKGILISNPAGAQFDDTFQLTDGSNTQVGIAATDPALEQQLASLRDTGTVISVWGTLLNDVPDVNGIQIQVTRIEIEAPEEATEPIEGWIGALVSNPQGAQFDDYFQMLDQNGSRFGISSLDPLLEQELEALRDTGQLIQVWGVLRRDVPDAYGTQIEVTRIAEYQ
ncbi:MAG: DUF333 domain-containing protein [Anaerolineae bacterium]|jgi:putative hemolysin|nr:DUF333 domain-containing protein [Anaerolineae bacterium]